MGPAARRQPPGDDPADERARGVLEGGCVLRRAGRPGAGRRGLPRRRRRHGSRDHARHHPAGRLRPNLPAGRDRSHHGDRCGGGRVRSALPRRRLHGVHPPVAGAARFAPNTVELRRARRDLHQLRPPQVRLHGEGCVGARASLEGPPQASVLPHRRLARWPVRVARDPRYPQRRRDRGGVGRNASSRRGRLPAPDEDGVRRTRAAGGRCAFHPGPRRARRPRDDARRVRRRVGFRSGARRLCGGRPFAAGGGWYCDRQTPPDSLHCTVHAGHEHTVDGFIDALRAAVDDQLADAGRVGDRTRAYGTT